MMLATEGISDIDVNHKTNHGQDAMTNIADFEEESKKANKKIFLDDASLSSKDTEALEHLQDSISFSVITDTETTYEGKVIKGEQDAVKVITQEKLTEPVEI